MKILIVEDDAAIRLELARFLEKYGYTCLCPADFTGIAAKAAETQPDLALLDINLPCQDGFSLCRQLRESPQTAGLPIIMLTSRTSDFDELLGLRVGADDYVTKPFNPQVLLARIQNLLARTAAPEAGAVLTHKGLTLYVLQAKMRCGDKEAELTRNELGILRLLMRSKGNVIPRDAIIDELWQSETFIDENTLNVNIVRLRKKLAAIGLPDYLETKRGMGYKV